MRVLLLDSSAVLDPATIRQLAAKAGLAPRVLHQPLDARALSDTLDAPVEYAGLLLYGAFVPGAILRSSCRNWMPCSKT